MWMSTWLEKNIIDRANIFKVYSDEEDPIVDWVSDRGKQVLD